jgi:hypothetical protein
MSTKAKIDSDQLAGSAGIADARGRGTLRRWRRELGRPSPARRLRRSAGASCPDSGPETPDAAIRPGTRVSSLTGASFHSCPRRPDLAVAPERFRHFDGNRGSEKE